MNEVSKINTQKYSAKRKEVPLHRYCAMFDRIVPPVERVLDIGCWDSGFLDLFPESTEKNGIDISERSFGSSIHFTKADISSGLPYPAGYFDVVTAGEIIEHLLYPIRFLTEIQRVLSPRGQLVLTTPNLSYWRNIIQLVRAKNFFWVDFMVEQNGHVRYFCPDTLAQLLRVAGFSDIRISSIEDVKGMALLNLVGKIFCRFSRLHNMNLVSYCRKKT